MWGGKVSKSCDVYSFGILLLEIINGRKSLEKLLGSVKRDIIQYGITDLCSRIIRLEVEISILRCSILAATNPNSRSRKTYFSPSDVHPRAEVQPPIQLDSSSNVPVISMHEPLSSGFCDDFLVTDSRDTWHIF